MTPSPRTRPMQGELREQVASHVTRAIVFFDAEGADKFSSTNAADAIIATIRDALLGEEVVEAGAQTMAGVGAAILPNERRDAKRLIEAAFAKIGAPNVAR